MADKGDGRKKGRAGKKKGRLSQKARKAKAERRKKSNGRRRAHMICVIAHPLRRRILRVIADGGESCSPAQIAEVLGLPVDTVGYHIKILWRFGAVEPVGEQQVRDATEHVYDSTIEDDPPIETLLDETREVDEEDEQ